MILNTEQQTAIENGEPVEMNVAGTDCILVRRDIYLRMDPLLETGSWTIEEMDLLSDEANEIISRENRVIIERGHVINARFPHASGSRGKKRPVVVIQANVYNARLRHAVVVQLTTNLDDKNDPACFLLEAATPEGQSAGITQDSLFSGYLISLMSEDRLHDVIGKLSDEVMLKADVCLKAGLGIG